MLSELRRNQGARTQKVLDFRGTTKQNDISEFKIAQGKLTYESEQRLKKQNTSSGKLLKTKNNVSLKTSQSHSQV